MRNRQRTQKNDLEIVREVLKVTEEVPIERAYDFSFAKKADSELTQAAGDRRNFSRVVPCEPRHEGEFS